MKANTLNIIVIGGGYAGIMAANRLAGHAQAGPRMCVHLVTAAPFLDERIRLPRVLGRSIRGPRPRFGREPDTLRPLTGLLHPRIQLVTGVAERIDRQAGLVHLSDGAALPFDRVLLATGSRLTAPTGTYSLDRSADLTPLRRELARSRNRQMPVRVVGGGFSGIEIAAEIAHGGWQSEIVDARAIGAALGPRAQKWTRKRLTRLGCRLRDGVRVGPEEGVLTVWATGPAPVTVSCSPPLPLTSDGRLRVDGALRSPADPRILAAGDCAAAPGAHLRPSCAAALALGACAAETVAAQVLGHPVPAADAGFVVRCLSLGGRTSLIELVRPDDTPRSLVMAGLAANMVKDAVVNSTLRYLRREARHSGSFHPPRGPQSAGDCAA